MNKHIIHLGVYGVILDAGKKNILLVRKSRGPFTGMLDLPGGTPEFDESFEETLGRELLEETGLELTQVKQLECLLNIFPDGEIMFRHIGIIYACQAEGNLNVEPDGHDSNGCVWLRVEQIESHNCTPFVNSIKKWREFCV